MAEETGLTTISWKFIRPGFRFTVTCNNYLPRASAS